MLCWHSSHILNGINLNKTIHNGYNAAHKVYNANLKKHLDDVLESGVINTAQKAKDFLIDLQQSIRNQLENGKKLDQIIF